MEIGFIGQGLNLHNQSLEALFDGSLSLNRSGHVAAALAESIADERCRIAVAFAQAEAVRIVQRQLSETAHEIETEVSIGIDFGSTSVGALEALAVSDIETYLFNHNRFTYHPELYHLVGPNFTRTIVGSTNLTTQGLNQNVEAAVVVETNGDDPFLDDISEFLDRIVELRTPLTPELLSDLVDADTIPTKSASDASNRSSTIDTHEWHDHSLPDNILADSSV